MKIGIGRFSAFCVLLLAAATALGCGSEGGRPRHLDPGVLHDNGGSGGAGQGLGGGDSDGGSSGTDEDELDAGTGGYQIGTDWDGNTRPTADNVRGIDAAAGVDERGNSLPPDSGEGDGG